jgi:hypothetical protein
MIYPIRKSLPLRSELFHAVFGKFPIDLAEDSMYTIHNSDVRVYVTIDENGVGDFSITRHFDHGWIRGGGAIFSEKRQIPPKELASIIKDAKVEYAVQQYHRSKVAEKIDAIATIYNKLFDERLTKDDKEWLTRAENY